MHSLLCINIHEIHEKVLEPIIAAYAIWPVKSMLSTVWFIISFFSSSILTYLMMQSIIMLFFSPSWSWLHWFLDIDSIDLFFHYPFDWPHKFSKLHFYFARHHRHINLKCLCLCQCMCLALDYCHNLGTFFAKLWHTILMCYFDMLCLDRIQCRMIHIGDLGIKFDCYCISICNA